MDFSKDNNISETTGSRRLAKKMDKLSKIYTEFDHQLGAKFINFLIKNWELNFTTRLKLREVKKSFEIS